MGEQLGVDDDDNMESSDVKCNLFCTERNKCRKAIDDARRCLPVAVYGPWTPDYGLGTCGVDRTSSGADKLSIDSFRLSGPDSPGNAETASRAKETH